MTTTPPPPIFPNKAGNFFSSALIQWLCALGLGGLFVYASIDKILNPQAFSRIVYNYQILPEMMIYFFALVLPWIELIAGVFVAINLFRRSAAIILAALLGVFIIAISFNLIRGINFDCGCFSTVSSKDGSDPAGLLIRDVLILLPALVIILFPRSAGPKKAP